MIKPLVLKFTDDIPESEFLFGADRDSEWQGKYLLCRIFRKPKDYPMAWAYARMRGECFMKRPIFRPATPAEVLLWLAGHPKEAAFRKTIKAPIGKQEDERGRTPRTR